MGKVSQAEEHHTQKLGGARGQATCAGDSTCIILHSRPCPGSLAHMHIQAASPCPIPRPTERIVTDPFYR